MISGRSRSRIQEDLVLLYLRLNGFFVTEFIVHSAEHGKTKTQVDGLALRMPYSSQPDRIVGPHELLGLAESRIELCLCEVKSRGGQLQFNRALYSDPRAVASVFRWAGVFAEVEVDSLAVEFAEAIRPRDTPGDGAPTLTGPNGTRIRGLLFSPERNARRPNQPWFVSGPELLQYVWLCLCPVMPRRSCSTTYDLHAWGPYEPIVKYFKSRGKDGPGDMEALYAFIDSAPIR
jgi:hypothetical protein